ncbi:MAG: hypothetical protein SGCHY_005267, partial [Lobulomycetales sp.]
MKEPKNIPALAAQNSFNSKGESPKPENRNSLKNSLSRDHLLHENAILKRPASYRQSANLGNASKGDLVVATQSLNRASNTTNNISSAPTSAASENSNGAILHEIVRGQGGADWRMYAGNSRPKSYLELLDIDDQDNEETRRTDRLLRLERSLSVKSNTSAHNVTLTRQPSTKRISSSFN